jgi:transglutaminase-like putative cysteine protease
MTIVDRLKSVNARQPPEEDLRVRICVLIAVTTAALAVVNQGVGSPAFRLLVVGGLPLAYWYSWKTRSGEGFWVKAIIALAAILTLGWFMHTLVLRAGGTFADAEVPLAQLLLLIQVLHGLDVPGRRDLLFSLLSSTVLMTVAGALSVSMALLPYIVVWGVAAVSALVLAQRSALAQAPALGPVGAGTVGGPSGVRVVAAILALSVAFGFGLFFVVPPAGTARALLFPAHLPQLFPLPSPGDLSNPTLGGGTGSGFPAEARVGRRSNRSTFAYFGFSTSLDLATRGRPDRSLVMRVRADGAELWRGQTFDVWDGRTWKMSDQQTQTLEGPLPISVPPPSEEASGSFASSGGSDLVQTYYLARPGPNLIFGAAPISRLYFPDRQVYELSDGTLRAGVRLGKGAVYTVVSRPPAVSLDDLRRPRSLPVPATILARYAKAPVTTGRVRALAQQVTASAATTYDKVVALQDWMGANLRYSLDVPPLPDGSDAVDQFVFVDRRGFCEQIATSLVVMLRSLGVPARVVAGYAPGQRNPFTGLYEVRGSDAHLWTEVWFPGVGWESFDPTAVVPLAGDHSTGSAGSGLGSYLAAHLPSVPGWVSAMAAVAGGLVVAGLITGRLARQWRLARRRPEPSWPDRCLARLETAGAARGRPRVPSETVYEYAAALMEPDAPPLDRVAALVTQAAFSNRPVAEDERRWVDQVLDELLSRS